MEVLLLITVLAVGASALYVERLLNKRTRQNASPMLEASSARLSEAIRNDSKDLKEQLHGLAADLARDRDLADARNTALQESLREVGSRLSAIAGQLAGDSEVIRHLGSQVPVGHEQLRSEIEELDRRVTQLGDSLTQQCSQAAAGVSESIDRTARLSGAGLAELKQSVQAVSRSHSRAEDELAAIGRVLGKHAEQGNRAELHDNWAAGQIAAAAAQLQMLADGQVSIGSYLRAGLDYAEARSSQDNRCRRIIAGGLSMTGPGSDILWQLLLSFCQAIPLRNLSPGQPGDAGSRSYFLWQSQDGRSLKRSSVPGSPESGKVTRDLRARSGTGWRSCAACLSPCISAARARYRSGP